MAGRRESLALQLSVEIITKAEIAKVAAVLKIIYHQIHEKHENYLTTLVGSSYMLVLYAEIWQKWTFSVLGNTFQVPKHSCKNSGITSP
jgi:hypothetical protein